MRSGHPVPAPATRQSIEVIEAISLGELTRQPAATLDPIEATHHGVEVGSMAPDPPDRPQRRPQVGRQAQSHPRPPARPQTGADPDQSRAAIEAQTSKVQTRQVSTTGRPWQVSQPIPLQSRYEGDHPHHVEASILGAQMASDGANDGSLSFPS